MTNKAIVLLSGGLDSLVSLGYVISGGNCNVEAALTFDYGQKSAYKEIEASKKICEFYGVKHKIITLDWLKDITRTSLVSDDKLPVERFGTDESMKAVWVPNRNGLFLNIAASFCDANGYEYIIYGANKDEGATFSDNTEAFRVGLNKVFELSTLVKPKVLAPLINYNKGDIVKIAVEKGMPLKYVWSCYQGGDVHCGNCESCYHLKKSLLTNGCDKYIKQLFKDEN